MRPSVVTILLQKQTMATLIPFETTLLLNNNDDNNNKLEHILTDHLSHTNCFNLSPVRRKAP